MDAARLLPIFGGVLLLLPILWGPSETEVRSTASDGMYLFLIWGVLVALAAWLAPGLADAADDDDAHGAGEAGSEPSRDAD